MTPVTQKCTAQNYVRKYMLKMLAKAARQLGHAENCIATLAHSDGVLQFIGHAGASQCLGCTHKITHPENGDAAVELAFLIAQADDHVGASEIWVDRFLQALQQSSVVLQWGDSVDKFGIHAWLSKVEGVDIGCALEHARKRLSTRVQQGGAA